MKIHYYDKKIYWYFLTGSWIIFSLAWCLVCFVFHFRPFLMVDYYLFLFFAGWVVHKSEYWYNKCEIETKYVMNPLSFKGWNNPTAAGICAIIKQDLLSSSRSKRIFLSCSMWLLSAVKMHMHYLHLPVFLIILIFLPFWS